MSVSECCWHWQDTVLTAGCQQVLYLYVLPTPRTPRSTCCELRFIQLVILSLLLSQSTVHYTAIRCGRLHSLNPSPLSSSGHTPFPPPCGRPLWMTPFVPLHALYPRVLRVSSPATALKLKKNAQRDANAARWL